MGWLVGLEGGAIVSMARTSRKPIEQPAAVHSPCGIHLIRCVSCPAGSEGARFWTQTRFLMLACLLYHHSYRSREDMVRTDTLDLDAPTRSSTCRNLCNLTGERALPKLSSANLADGCSPT